MNRTLAYVRVSTEDQVDSPRRASETVQGLSPVARPGRRHRPGRRGLVGQELRTSRHARAAATR